MILNWGKKSGNAKVFFFIWYVNFYRRVMSSKNVEKSWTKKSKREWMYVTHNNKSEKEDKNNYSYKSTTEKHR